MTARSPVPAARRHRPLVWGLAATQTVSWGILYYALPVLIVPIEDDLGWSRPTIVGAYALATLVSAVAAPAVGRHLDRHDGRALMTAGSVLAVVLVLAWSQASTPLAFYVVWAAIGLAQAAVLYDAGLTVVIKRCAPDHAPALLTVTLAGGLASFVFQPLTSRLADAYGWRTALVVLAAIVGAVTIPVHWLALRTEPAAGTPRARTPAAPPPAAPPPAVATPPDRRFWQLTAGFTAVATTSFATGVLLVAYLVDHGWTLGRAALASGVLGAMQLPGRFAFTRFAPYVSDRTLTTSLLVLPAAGVLLVLASDGGPLVWPAVACLGVGQGSSILLRTALLTNLYGVARIGALNGASAVPVSCARALAPLGASYLVARATSYGPAFLLLAGAGVGGMLVARAALGGPG